jgi:hypothetical protein
MDKQKTPALGHGRQGLDNDFDNQDSSTKPTKLTNSRNGRKALNQTARKWAARGYYSTPSEALKALLECTGHV